MVRELLASKRLLSGIAVLAAIVGTGLALWPLHSGGHTGSTLKTATAGRGNIVLTVGGVGRIVEARAAGQMTVPAATAASAAAPTSASSSQTTTAPPDAVFAGVTGRLAKYLVAPGQHVSANEPIAVIDDASAAAIALDQARGDLATARLELRQKQTSDPAKGLPPTPAELRAARLALHTANERARQIGHPTAADVASGRLEVSKARADLETLTRKPTPAALTAARLAVDVATLRLDQTNGPATAVDVSSARAELAKAQSDLDALVAPSATAIQAGQLAVTLAQQRITELAPGAAASDVTAAQLELKKAQADLEALQAGPRAAALAAAQASVDLAAQRLAQVTGPPTALTVASSQLDLEKAQSDLEALQRAVGVQALAAGRSGVRLAQLRLAQLLHPAAATLDAGRADVAKAVADLEVLTHRGAPAGQIDIGIARLKVQAAASRVSAALRQVEHLTVHTPVGGTVTALLLAPGAPTDASTPIATVADLRHLAVSVDLSEFDIARVRLGDAALMSVDALGGTLLPGRVVYVAFTGADSGGVVTFPVRVALTHSASVKPGMNVSVKIIVARRRGVVLVPLDAVTGHTVTVVDTGGRTSRRPVVLGLADNKQVEISSGLRPGERVLLGTGGG